MDPYISTVRGQYSSVDVARELHKQQDHYGRNPFTSAQGSDFLPLDYGQRYEHRMASIRNSLTNPDFLPLEGRGQHPAGPHFSTADYQVQPHPGMFKAQPFAEETMQFDASAMLYQKELERLYMESSMQVQDQQMMNGIGPGGLAMDYGGYGGGGIQDLIGQGGMDLVNGGDLQAALGLLNGPGVDENGEIQLPPGVEPGTKEYNDFLQELEAQGLIEIREEIVEVPQVVVEERVVHVPGKKQIQERLIEVPKVVWVERVEYEDYVEYREVPVDKIIEVPEIEYKIKHVDQTVPQTYIQEHFVDKFREVPVTQVQEAERVEHVPVTVPKDWQPPRSEAMDMKSSPAAQITVT
mmetsp:Transcript_32771/g.40271  ORF Transcript_32771/g.40271 Transcript_32771/m.40271 type:complete len:352 (-) Transcript_32771:80-1135(-)